MCPFFGGFTVVVLVILFCCCLLVSNLIAWVCHISFHFSLFQFGHQFNHVVPVEFVLRKCFTSPFAITSLVAGGDRMRHVQMVGFLWV